MNLHYFGHLFAIGQWFAIVWLLTVAWVEGWIEIEQRGYEGKSGRWGTGPVKLGWCEWWCWCLVLEVVTLMRASALFPDIDSCHVFIVSLYLFDSVPRQAESSVLRRLSVSGNLVISTSWRWQAMLIGLEVWWINGQAPATLQIWSDRFGILIEYTGLIGSLHNLWTQYTTTRDKGRVAGQRLGRSLSPRSL